MQILSSEQTENNNSEVKKIEMKVSEQDQSSENKQKTESLNEIQLENNRNQVQNQKDLQSNSNLSKSNLDDELGFSFKMEENHSLSKTTQNNLESKLNIKNQTSELRDRPSGRDMLYIYSKQRQSKDVTIYKDEFKDKLMLSPIKKYVKYNKFPYKLLIHISLIIFTSLQIEYTHSQFTPFSRQQDYEWVSLFYNDNQAADNNGIYTYYDIKSFQSHLNSLFINIATYNQKYFQQINLEKLKIFLQYAPEPITKKDLFVKFENNPIDPFIGITYPFNQHDINSIKKFLGQTRRFSINVNNLAVTLAHEKEPYSCWNFQLQYQYISTIYLQSVLQADGKMCDDYVKVTRKLSEATILFKGSQVLINSIIIVLASVSFILGLKYIFDMIKDYMHYKKQGQILKPIVNKPKKKQVNDMDEEYLPDNLIQILHEQRAWDELTFSEKLKYFDKWFIIILLGNLCQISCCLFILLQDKHDNLVSRLSEPFRWLQGLGCSLAWLAILKYFDYFSKFNITADIMRYSFPKIGKHFIGYIPILASFIIVGRTAFGGSQRFATMRDSFATLFSLLLGDSINDITHDLEDNGISRPLAVIYIVSFIILFILAVNNIMIAIIQDEGSRRKEVIKRDQEYKKLDKYKKKLEKARKIEEQKLKQRMESDYLDEQSQQGRFQNEQSEVHSFRTSQQIDEISINEQQQQKIRSQLQSQKELRINTSNQDSLSSSISQRERKEGGTVISSETNQLQQYNQIQDILQQQSNPLDPVVEDLRESLQKEDEEMKQQDEKTDQQQNADQQDQIKIENSQQLHQNLDSIEFEGSQQSFSHQQSHLQLTSKQHSQRSKIDTNSKKNISFQALTKIAIQLMKSKHNAQEKINLKDEFNKEVELLTEQQMNYKEFYKQLKKGFSDLTQIIDKQSFEIRDNLYLYQISKPQRGDIINEFCDILNYLTLRIKQQQKKL
ncbi:cation channel family transporter (macronuclear) [Tetrahymena thermophila SB210]|uniref:Cation channel family transporter n=1 Tax=Tetrahymena thermophila (strain SB210) TaxID=312017 RepID=I7M9T6_TETTS|nr:cation channel family transporter [Tetrahymena thermophila SB210]EAS02783.2 cation channel family transporter [Tetrahymena thermophila SB210]|eukprot:XP_001023028.2 cation channel family transporter [Tetrahymena thermophila SB210]